MSNSPNYYAEDPVKAILRKTLIREGNKILKESTRHNLNPEKLFIRDTLAYLKMDIP